MRRSPAAVDHPWNIGAFLRVIRERESGRGRASAIRWIASRHSPQHPYNAARGIRCSAKAQRRIRLACRASTGDAALQVADAVYADRCGHGGQRAGDRRAAYGGRLGKRTRGIARDGLHCRRAHPTPAGITTSAARALGLDPSASEPLWTSRPGRRRVSSCGCRDDLASRERSTAGLNGQATRDGRAHGARGARRAARGRNQPMPARRRACRAINQRRDTWADRRGRA